MNKKEQESKRLEANSRVKEIRKVVKWSLIFSILGTIITLTANLGGIYRDLAEPLLSREGESETLTILSEPKTSTKLTKKTDVPLEKPIAKIKAKPKTQNLNDLKLMKRLVGVWKTETQKKLKRDQRGEYMVTESWFSFAISPDYKFSAKDSFIRSAEDCPAFVTKNILKAKCADKELRLTIEFKSQDSLNVIKGSEKFNFHRG